MDDADRRFREAARRMDEYRSGDSRPALDAAVDLLREAVALVGDDDPRQAAMLAGLGAALSARARRLGRGADLAESVAVAREAVARTAPADDDLGRRLSNLTDALLTRFGVAGDLADLDEAVAAGRRAVHATAPDHPMAARRSINLAAALAERSEATGSEEDLAAAVEAARAAGEAAPAGSADHAMTLSALGNVLLSRYDRHGDPADPTAAADAYRRAADAVPVAHPDRFGYLCNLGVALWRQYEDTAQPPVLDDAIARLREALAGLSPDHPHHLMCQENLGNALHSRFERTGDLEDLHEAVDLLARVAKQIPAGHPDRPAHLSNLAVVRQSRYERLSDLGDADRAVEDLEEAVARTPQRHPDRATYLANLAGALGVRAQATGREADLSRAVDLLTAAVAATPADHPERATFLSGLSGALATRFRRYGEPADVDAAVDVARRAVAATRPGDPDLAGHRANLSVALRDRFLRTHQGKDIAAAVIEARAAVDATPAGHPDRATYLTNLGAALRTRFDDEGPRPDLDAAVEALAGALAATAVEHPLRPARLSNLGSALRARHARDGGRADLDTAIDRLREAVATIAADHPDRAGMLHNLGRALRELFAVTGDRAHADDAVAREREAGEVGTAPPEVRLTAARAWARFARDTGDLPSATDGYTAAITLLPIAAWHGLERGTREAHLADNAGLATEAVVAALEAGEPPRAIELLEQARSVLWRQALHLRSDLTRLAATAPSLAERLDSVRAELSRPATGNAWAGLPPGTEQIRVLDARRRLAAEWDELVRQARAIEGFADFLAPTPFVRLREAAAGGPVIVLIAGERGGYALVVTAGGDPGVEVVRLPMLTHEAAATQANLLLAATSSGAVRSRSTVRLRKIRDLVAADPAADREVPFQVLAWLWDAAARPVLDHLGYAGGSELPRVWWSLVGPVAMLPLHAAGRYRAGGTAVDSVPARTVSSYTPTLAALIRARGGTGGAVRQLAVAMSRTPKLTPLPAVTRELAILARRLPPPGSGLHLENRAATRDAVRSALRSCPWAHFACHGTQHETDPAQSAFVLWDGPLTLEELAGIAIDRAELAFLSACQTATGSPLLMDEAVHLVAAMQLLGYRHVIGTLWSIEDAAAPEVADAVYGLLEADGFKLRHTAEALREAVERLRKRFPDRPLLWAPFVHFGP